jgi:hypothetical protein
MARPTNAIAGRPGASCRGWAALAPTETLDDEHVRDAGRLNLFQRMMLRWRSLHPYNPVHVVRVPAALDAPRLRAVVAARLEALGLTGLEVDAARGRFRYAGGRAELDLPVLPASDGASQALRGLIEREFNRPFEGGAREQPWRFVAVDAAGSFHLALSYDHFVAGGDAIARLLTDIALTYLDGEATPPAWTLQRYPVRYRGVFARHPGWALRALLALPPLATSNRRAFRLRLSNADDVTNGFVQLRLEPPQLRALLAACKAWEVTLNDLLLAALLQALSPLAEARWHEARRKQIAVASIMNIKRDISPGAGAVLSPCLAALRIAHDVPAGLELRSLALQVHAASSALKSQHRYLSSLFGLGLSALIWPFLNAAQRGGLYAKHYPLWAGVTTLNLNPIWSGSSNARTEDLDYLRAVPTGPMTPLVLAATTAHEVLHLGIAYRQAAYTPAAVEGIAASLLRCLADLQA